MLRANPWKSQKAPHNLKWLKLVGQIRFMMLDTWTVQTLPTLSSFILNLNHCLLMARKPSVAYQVQVCFEGYFNGNL